MSPSTVPVPPQALNIPVAKSLPQLSGPTVVSPQNAMPPPSRLNNHDSAKLPLGWLTSYSAGGGTGTRGELMSRTVQVRFRSGLPVGWSVTVQTPVLSGLEFDFVYQ